MNGGNVGIGTTTPAAKLDVVGNVAATVVLAVQGAASQSANLQQWKDSGGAVKASVTKDGSLVFGGTATKQVSGGPELITAIHTAQDNLILWAGLSTDTEGRFLMSARGFLEWGAGGTSDQDVALFRHFTGGTKPGLSVQHFGADVDNSEIFRVNAPSPTGGPEGPEVFAVDAENMQVRFGAGATGFAGSQSIRATRRLKTTNATATALFSLALEDLRAYYFVVRVVARRPSPGEKRAFFYRAACFFREGGDAMLAGNVVNLATEPSTTPLICTLQATGINVEVLVTGEAADVFWVGTIEYQSVKTDAVS